MMHLHAISPVHTGTGQAADVIDLPVARETTTGWPYIPGSSIKGVLRSLCDPGDGATPQEQARFREAFGPPTENASDAAGALLFGDGRLLCLPVRSLFGTFVWVTCPLALDRYRRDYEAAGISTPPGAGADDIGDGEIALAASPSRVADHEVVYLEDLDLRVAGTAAAPLATHVARSVFDDDTWRGHFMGRFGIVSDTTFSFLTETATDITARIRIKPDTKTVASGALWYEEAIPAETIFSTPLLAAPRNGTVGAHLFDVVAARLHGAIQIGGNASVGRGLMRVRLQEGE